MNQFEARCHGDALPVAIAQHYAEVKAFLRARPCELRALTLAEECADLHGGYAFAGTTVGELVDHIYWHGLEFYSSHRADLGSSPCDCRPCRAFCNSIRPSEQIGTRAGTYTSSCSIYASHSLAISPYRSPGPWASRRQNWADTAVATLRIAWQRLAHVRGAVKRFDCWVATLWIAWQRFASSRAARFERAAFSRPYSLEALPILAKKVKNAAVPRFWQSLLGAVPKRLWGCGSPTLFEGSGTPLREVK